MPHERLKPTFTFDEDRLADLKRVVPEAFADGKVNWDALREALGENLEEEGKEHYAFTWPSKREAKKLAAKPPQGTLVPVKGEGINEDTTGNIFIEGDNLEVLKLLQKSYAGKIKMIYIDPPYNTGSDLIYKDDFEQPLEEYLKITGQVDSEGVAQTTNKRADGRFHTNWLNMMWPRLSLARNLLTEDGVILVSIGDEEITSLSHILKEIFGEGNHSANFCIIRSEGGGLAKQVVKGHDYLLVYAKNISTFSPLRRPKDIRGEIVELDGVSYWIEEDWLRREFGKYGTCEYKEIEKFHGVEKKKEIDQGIKQGLYRLLTKRDGSVIVGRLRKIEEDASKFYSVQKHLNAKAAEDLEKIKMPPIFDYPKPTSLIREIVLGASFFSKQKEDIVLDFFAGSGTTGHAVMAQNVADGGNRRFILVQLPEKLDPENNEQKAAVEFCDKLQKPRNIAELTKERLRRACGVMGKENKTFEGDLGFKVFRYTRSSFKRWADYKGSDLFELENHYADAKTPLLAGWKKKDLLTEVMLIKGFPLDSQMMEIKDIKSNSVVEVATSFCEHKLFVCLDEKVDKTTIAALTLNDKDVFVCLDTALTDEQKVRLSDKGFLATI
jgi:adenine-specific DNA-methyltransferase